MIVYYWLSWRSIPEYFSSAEKPSTGFSVIIPARNEERNIIGSLESVCAQHYPTNLLQIIAIDDCSTDKTWDLVRNFRPGERLINSTRLGEVEDVGFSAHKKRAIETGIAISRNDVIVTTDADCKHPLAWIAAINSPGLSVVICFCVFFFREDKASIAGYRTRKNSSRLEEKIERNFKRSNRGTEGEAASCNTL